MTNVQPVFDFFEKDLGGSRAKTTISSRPTAEWNEAGCQFSTGYHIFADGAAVPNPGAGGWGVVVYRDGVEVEALKGGEPDTTNNRMEMSALLIAIETAAARIPAPVTIWSDSQYCVNGANDWRHKWKRHGWRKSPSASELVKNAEIWQAIDAALEASESGYVAIKWVKGHAGIVGNERADQLAEIGRQDALDKLSVASRVRR